LWPLIVGYGLTAPTRCSIALKVKNPDRPGHADPPPLTKQGLAPLAALLRTRAAKMTVPWYAPVEPLRLGGHQT
jgi:hypothetical protein